jgi:hypothetical protein
VGAEGAGYFFFNGMEHGNLSIACGGSAFSGRSGQARPLHIVVVSVCKRCRFGYNSNR